ESSMSLHPRLRLLCVLLVSSITTLTAWSTFAQSVPTSDTSTNTSDPNTAALLKKVDQLVKQNQDLLEEIKVLRNEVAKRADVSAQGAGASPPQTSASGKDRKQSGQSSGPDSGTGDDKARFPEASEGNPAIFGEFNPGRGFTVGRGEHGELNLSGYMVARYLNQLPADQSAVDPLGLPPQVTPP